MYKTIEHFSGLTANQVQYARARFGWNKLESKPGISPIRRLLREPMLVLLTIASTLYFATGSYAEGIFMVFAIFTLAFIARYQESKSDAALKALLAYTCPTTSVIREGKVCQVATEELVLGDFFLIEEGGLIPADGIIQLQHDLSVNESMLTGESIAVNKAGADKSVYQGTLVGPIRRFLHPYMSSSWSLLWGPRALSYTNMSLSNKTSFPSASWLPLFRWCGLKSINYSHDKRTLDL